MALDAGYKALVDAVRASGMPGIGSVSAQEMRAWQEGMLGKLPPGPDGETWRTASSLRRTAGFRRGCTAHRGSPGR